MVFGQYDPPPCTLLNVDRRWAHATDRERLVELLVVVFVGADKHDMTSDAGSLPLAHEPGHDKRMRTMLRVLMPWRLG